MLGRYLIIGSMALSAVTAAGWYVTKGRLDSVRDDLRDAQAVNRSLVAARTEERRLADVTSASAATYYAQLEVLQNENEKLRDARAAGTVGLRVQADCPRMPATAQTGSVDTDAGPRLNAGAERHYHALRDQIARVTKQLGACQDWVRVVTADRPEAGR